MLKLLFALVLAATVYVPETIVGLSTSPYAHVAVRGVASSMHLQNEAVVFWLADREGHRVECVIPSGSRVTLPSIGKPLVVKGARKIAAVKDQTIVSLDPVEAIEVIEE
jgi:hypothetical protein